MPIVVGALSQKGGVTKTGCASLIAVSYANAQWKVLVADLDTSQGSLTQWNTFRTQNKLKPALDVRTFGRVDEAMAFANQKDYDLVIFDGAPHASQATKAVAAIADLIILPTGASILDLNPQIHLAHELVDNGIDASRILFVMSRMGKSKTEKQEVRDYLQQAGYKIAAGSIPEKTAFRRAFIEGKTFTEVPYPTLKKASEEVVQSIVDTINGLTK